MRGMFHNVKYCATGNNRARNLKIVERCEKMVLHYRLKQAYESLKRPSRLQKGETRPQITTAPKAVADEICRRLVAGETLDAICSDETMPSVPTLWRWRKADPGLEHRIVQASQSVRLPARVLPTQESNPEQWTPLGIMLHRMRELWADGQADVEDKREAISIAKDAAPYVHPRLSAIDARVTHRDLRDLGEDELLRELALLREQAGMLLPHLDASRLPVVIEHEPEAVAGEPDKGHDGGSGDYQSPDLEP